MTIWVLGKNLQVLKNHAICEQWIWCWVKYQLPKITHLGGSGVGQIPQKNKKKSMPLKSISDHSKSF